MDWSTPTLWWFATGVLIAAELATGTFYLLMVALGCAAGALAAHAGVAGTQQIVVAAIVGFGATAAWHVKRLRSAPSTPAQRNRDVNIDIGQTVQVDAWNDDGSARIQYRGAGWTVRFTGADAPRPGRHVIVGLDGSQLQVAAAAAH